MEADYEEEKRVTLLDIIEEKNRDLNKKGLIHSMIIIAHMKSKNYEEIAEHYEKLFQDVQAQTLCEGATGLLIFFPTLCVHVVEGGLEILLEFARDVRRDHYKTEDPYMENAKILLISHDIPDRLYQAWAFLVEDVVAPNLDNFDTTEKDEKIVTDLVLQLLKLGDYIRHKHQSMNTMSLTIENLHDAVPHLIPLQAILNYLIRNDIPCMMLPEEYLRIYEVPYDVRLASDFVWPLSLRKLPYNWALYKTAYWDRICVNLTVRLNLIYFNVFKCMKIIRLTK